MDQPLLQEEEDIQPEEHLPPLLIVEANQPALEEMFKTDELKLDDLLGIPNIHRKIRRALPAFIDYCRQHEQFGLQFIDASVTCCDDLPHGCPKRQVVFAASEILTSDYDVVADFLVYTPEQPSRRNSGDQIQQQIVQELTPYAPTDRFVFLRRLLSHLNDSIASSSLTYLTKALSCVVRKKICHFLTFLMTEPNIQTRLLGLLHHSCVSQLLARLVVQEVPENSFDLIRNNIVESVISLIHSSVSETNFTAHLDFVDEMLDFGRHLSNQPRSGAFLVAKLLSARSEVQLYSKRIDDPKQTLLTRMNCIAYLAILMQRMRLAETQSQTQSKAAIFNQESTSSAQQLILSQGLQDFVNNFLKLFIAVLKQSQGCEFEKDGKILRLRICELMTTFLKIWQVSSINFSREYQLEAIRTLIDLFFTDQSTGLVKFYYQDILERLLSGKCGVRSLIQQDWIEILATIREKLDASPLGKEFDHQLKGGFRRAKSNSNEQLCYVYKLLFVLDNQTNQDQQLKQPSKIFKQKFPQLNLIQKGKTYLSKTQLIKENGTAFRSVYELEFLRKHKEIYDPTSEPLVEITQEGGEERNNYPEEEFKLDDIKKGSLNLKLNLKAIDLKKSQLLKRRNEASSNTTSDKELMLANNSQRDENSQDESGVNERENSIGSQMKLNFGSLNFRSNMSLIDRSNETESPPRSGRRHRVEEDDQRVEGDRKTNFTFKAEIANLSIQNIKSVKQQGTHLGDKKSGKAIISQQKKEVLPPQLYYIKHLSLL